MKINTLSDAFSAYSRHVLFDASPGTLNQFRVTMRHARAALGREVKLKDINDDLVLSVFERLKARGRSPATANKCRSNLLAIWRWLCRRNILKRWPDVSKLREPKRLPVAWSRNEVAKLWAALECLPGRVAGIPASDWWIALHSLVWDTGERIGAVLKLEWSDVGDDGTIVFRAENRKGRTADKVHRLHPTTVALLDRLRRPNNQVVFAWDRSRCMIWLRYAEILKRAGLPTDRRHKFHALRRTVASFYEAAGGNATELLGHSSREVTRQHYLDPRITGTISAACDVLFRPAS